MHRPNPTLRGMLLAALLAGGMPALRAQEAPAPTAPTGVIESARLSVRSTTLWLASSVDSWFGDIPFEEGGQVTDGRLSFSLLLREHEKPDWSLRFNARLRLPNVERRAYLFVGRDDEREIVTDKPGTFSRPQQLLPESREDRTFFAGFGVALQDALDFRLGFRGGLKPYAQARWRGPWQIDEARRVELRQTFFWSLDDHLGSTTALAYEQALTPVLAARWVTAGTVTQVSETLAWSSLVGLHRAFGAERLLSLEALVNGRLDSGVGASDYGMQLRWEQPLHRQGLFGELLVGHFRPRKDAESERVRAWALGGQLKLKF